MQWIDTENIPLPNELSKQYKCVANTNDFFLQHPGLNSISMPQSNINENLIFQQFLNSIRFKPPVYKIFGKHHENYNIHTYMYQTYQIYL